MKSSGRFYYWFPVFCLIFSFHLSFADQDPDPPPGFGFPIKTFQDHSPFEVERMLKKNHVLLEEVYDPQVIPYFASPLVNYDPATVLWNITRQGFLFEDKPENHTASWELMRAAAVQNPADSSTADFYRQATQLDPSYFLPWLRLGYYHIFTTENSSDLLEVRQGVNCLLNVLLINPVCAEAHTGLAQAYRVLDKPKSIDEISKAYLCGRFAKDMDNLVKGVLKDSERGFRTDRLEFPFNVQKTSSVHCRIIYRDTDGAKWAPMARCLANWMMDEGLQDVLKKGGDDVKVSLCLDCLMAEYYSLQLAVSNNQSLTPQEKLFLEATRKGYGVAILDWELSSGRIPWFMLTLSQKRKSNALEYIQKYVFDLAG